MGAGAGAGAGAAGAGAVFVCLLYSAEGRAIKKKLGALTVFFFSRSRDRHATHATSNFQEPGAFRLKHEFYD